MIKILNEQDIRAMLTGAALYGAGGGGSLKTALTILDSEVVRNKAFSVRLADVDELSADGSAVAMFGMHTAGALADKKAPFVREASTAITAIRQAAYMAGKRIEAIFPMENGAVSTMVSILASVASGMPLVDADGCGRGVPGIDVTLLEKGQISFSPAVLCDDRENVIRIFPYQAADAKAAENMCHYLCAAFGNVAALSAWITNSKEIEAKLIPGSLSAAKKVGDLILCGAGNGTTVCEALEKALAPRLLASGKVVEKSESAVRITSADGKEYCADVSVVTTRFRMGEEILASCPDLICALDMDRGQPVTNDEVEPGMTLRYYVLPASKKWSDFADRWNRYL